MVVHDGPRRQDIPAWTEFCRQDRCAVYDKRRLAGPRPLALDEFNGPRGGYYKNMFAKCPAGRPGTADEVANVAELLMSDKGAFITGSTFLIDGGATASYFYGPLRPEKA